MLSVPCMILLLVVIYSSQNTRTGEFDSRDDNNHATGARVLQLVHIAMLRCDAYSSLLSIVSECTCTAL